MSLSVGAVLTLAALALPSPPPGVITRETRTFGTIHIDHPAHLAARAACSGCHGPGPITKVGRMTPPEAHERCFACHLALQRGPRVCRGCHVVAGEPGPAVPRPPPGGWRGLRWGMSTAGVRAALAEMSAEGGLVRDGSVSSAPRPGLQRFTATLHETMGQDVVVSRALLEFRNDQLRAMRLFVDGRADAGARSQIQESLAGTYGPPEEDPVAWDVRETWTAKDTEITVVPAIPDVTPIQIWLSDVGEP